MSFLGSYFASSEKLVFLDVLVSYHEGANMILQFSDIWPVQSQIMARNLKLWLLEEQELNHS